MSIFSNIKNIFKTKEAKTGSGYNLFSGFSIIDRLTARPWFKKKYLEVYEKSLYVFACVSKIAQKSSEIELKLYKIKNSKGDTEEIFDHPALDLIYKPNAFTTKSEFMQNNVINRNLSGDAFAVKIRNDRNDVVELWPLRPDLITIIADEKEMIKGYEYTREEDGKTIPILKEDMIHWKFPSPLQTYFGASPLAAAAMRIDSEEFATRFQRDFFLNNARPDAVLEMPNMPTAQQVKQIKKEWEKKYKGVGKNSKIAILGGGVKYQQISISQKDMDYIEFIKATRDDILVAFKTPKPIVAITDDVNRANAETAMTIFLSETIKPELRAYVEKLNEMLIYPEFGEEYYIDFDDPTPENRDQIVLEYASALQNNWMMINEVRQREGLPPIKGGNTLYLNPLMSPAGGLSQSGEGKAIKLSKEDWRMKVEKNPDEKLKVFRGKRFLRIKMIAKEQTADKVKQIFQLKKTGKKNRLKTKSIICLIKDEIKEQYAEMVLKRIDEESPKLKKAIISFSKEQMKRFIDNLKDEAKGLKVIDNFKKELTEDKIKKAFKKKQEDKLLADLYFPLLVALAEVAGEEALDTISPAESFEVAKMKEILKKRATMFAESVNSTTLEKLSNTLGEGIGSGEGIRELADRVQEVYSDFSDYRADRIARTETTAANNEGFIEAYKQSGVATHKEWIAVMDSRTREEHALMNGEVVKLDEAFSNGLQYPQEPNCRCVIGAAFKEE